MTTTDTPPAVTTTPAGGGTIPGPRVVGVDISLTATGLASSAGWCHSLGVDKLTTLPLPQRQAALRDLGVDILTSIGHPDLVVIEAPAYSRSGGGNSERAGLWWHIVHALAGREIPVVEVMSSTRIRYATGKGVGSKGAVIDAVARRFPDYQTGGDDNCADAVVLMAMGRDHLGLPLAAMPQAHRAALAAVRWPEMPALDPAGVA